MEGSTLWNYEESKPMIKGSWLYDMYVFTHFTGALKMSDRIFYMMRDNCNMNPVEAIPHIIKNEFDHILVRNTL
jgi:hypothetical protein